MKTIYQLLLLLFVGLFVITGCNKGGEEEEIIPQYLVDFERHAPAIPLTAQNINGMIQAVSAEFPDIDISSLTAKVKYNVEVHKIVYKTLFEGDTIMASGIVATPVQQNKNDVFPVMSYQHGTIFRKAEAPSVNISQELMTYMASTGMVVVIPDYIGFGASAAEFHPYMHNEYTVNAVLDMIRASKEFVKTEKPCNINNKLFLFGYSQGGSATVGALSAIENDNNNSDLTVTAAAAGAGAYDLAQLRRWIMLQQRYDKPSYIVYLIESFSRYAGVSNGFDNVFAPQFAENLSGMIDGATPEQTINESFGTFHVGSLFNFEFRDNDTFETAPEFESLRNAFTENKISGWANETDLIIYSGTEDSWVPLEQSTRLHLEFQQQGGKSEIIRHTGQDHIGSFIPSVMHAIDFFLSK